MRAAGLRIPDVKGGQSPQPMNRPYPPLPDPPRPFTAEELRALRAIRDERIRFHMLMETDELHAYVDADLARCMDLHIERIFRQASQAAQALKRQQPDPPIVHRIRRGLLRILRAIEHRLDER